MFGTISGHQREDGMSQDQKDRIIEAVELAKHGFITRDEMIRKIQQAAEIEAFEETVG
jgi:hypothetical protein